MTFSISRTLCSPIHLSLACICLVAFTTELAAGAPPQYHLLPDQVRPAGFTRVRATQLATSRIEASSQKCPLQVEATPLESDDTFGFEISIYNQSGDPVRVTLEDQQIDDRAKPGVPVKLFPKEGSRLLYGFSRAKDVLVSGVQHGPRVLSFDVDNKPLCEQRISLVPSASAQASAPRSYDRLMFNGNVGASLVRSGALKDVGGSGHGTGGLDVGFYSESFGFVMGILMESLGGGSQQLKDKLKAVNPAWQRPEARYIDISLMGSYRNDFTANWRVSYDLGVNFMDLQYGDEAADRLTESKFLFGLMHRVAVVRKITSWKYNPFDEGHLLIGPMLFHVWNPGGDIEGLSVAGHSAGAMLTLQVWR